MHTAFERLRRAWKYAFGDLSTEESQQIIADCRQRAGWHPLLVLSVDDALKHIRDTYVDHPALPRLVTRACEEIERKCGGALNDERAAKEWASRLARTYAKDEGLILTKWEEVLPKRLFDRSETAPPRQPAAHAAAFSSTTAEIFEHTRDPFPRDSVSRRLRNEQIIAAALHIGDEFAPAE
jgi:hypothetical protein